MESEEMSSEGGIGGMPSLGVVGGYEREKKIWHKGNGSFKRIKDQIKEEKGGNNEYQHIYKYCIPITSLKFKLLSKIVGNLV